ncbi:MAG: hypothetical protein J6K32_07045 [Clostridia bacterium]|nr:hypothetical protein [Clostridia bacterium]
MKRWMVMLLAALLAALLYCARMVPTTQLALIADVEDAQWLDGTLRLREEGEWRSARIVGGALVDADEQTAEAPGQELQPQLTEEGGLFGLKDAQGRTILAPVYDEIREVERSLFEGEPKVDYGYGQGRHYGVTLKGKPAFVDSEGRVTCRTGLPWSEVNFYGDSLVYQDAQDRIHVLAADGSDTTYRGIIGVFCMQSTGGRLYAVQDYDFRWGVTDYRGRMLLPRIYGHIECSADGRYLIAHGDYGGAEIYEIHYDVKKSALSLGLGEEAYGALAAFAGRLAGEE